ncbi:hypothetical protein SC1_02565 [Sphingopyxis sp. C-1]|nr:hypothetical protein SC1_02565 [Sphingopyxis sp. C-1]
MAKPAPTFIEIWDRRAAATPVTAACWVEVDRISIMATMNNLV